MRNAAEADVRDPEVSLYSLAMAERTPVTNGGAVVVRSTGYLALCLGVLLLILGVSVGAFVDPRDGLRDPDWMFWPWAIALLALLIRGLFVGVSISDVRVTRRTWLRSHSWPRSDIVRVSSAGYSGNLNRGSISRRFLMVTLNHRKGALIEVPELSGSRRTADRCVRRLAAALDA